MLARTVSVMMTTSPALASTCLMYSLKRSPCLSEVGHRKSVRSSGQVDVVRVGNRHSPSGPLLHSLLLCEPGTTAHRHSCGSAERKPGPVKQVGGPLTAEAAVPGHVVVQLDLDHRQAREEVALAIAALSSV